MSNKAVQENGGTSQKASDVDREIFMQAEITLWFDKTLSDLANSDLARLVWKAMILRFDVSFDDFQFVHANVNEPQPVEDQEGFPGWQIVAILTYYFDESEG